MTKPVEPEEQQHIPDAGVPVVLQSLPPEVKQTKLIADAVVDAAAIAAVTTLAILKLVPGEVALTMICIVSGSWIGARLKNIGVGKTSGVLAGLAGAAWEVMKR